jgi:hypothetical protein
VQAGLRCRLARSEGQKKARPDRAMSKQLEVGLKAPY